MDLQECEEVFYENSEGFMPVSPVYLNSVLLLSNELDSDEKLETVIGHGLCTNTTTPPANVCELRNLEQCEILLLDENYTVPNGVVGSQEHSCEILGTVDTNEITLAEQNESHGEQDIKEIAVNLSCDDTSFSRNKELSQGDLEDVYQESLDSSYVPNTSDDFSDSGMEDKKIVSKSKLKKKLCPSAKTKTIHKTQECSTRGEDQTQENILNLQFENITRLVLFGYVRWAK